MTMSAHVLALCRHRPELPTTLLDPVDYGVNLPIAMNRGPQFRANFSAYLIPRPRPCSEVPHLRD